MKLAVPALLALSCVLTAQDGSPLVFRTADLNVVEGLNDGEFFTLTGDIPALDGGHHYVMTVDDEGALDITTAAGEAPLLEIQARPYELLDMFGDEVEQFHQRVKGFIVLGAGQMGVPTRDAMGLVRSIFDFPADVEMLSVTVTGNPDRPAEGFDTHIVLTPAEGSWFAELMANMAPSSIGAPVIDEPDAFLEFSMAADMKDTTPWQPVVAFTAAFGAKNDEQKKQRSELLTQMMECVKPSVTTTWSPSSGMTGIMNVTDGEKLAALMQGDVHVTWSNAGVGSTDTEYETKALEHRGVTMNRSITYIDQPQQMPFARDGEMRMYEGVAGDYSIWRGFGADDDDVKNLIDAALDQRIGAAPLPGDTLLRMKLMVPDLVDYMTGGMMPMGDNMPNEMALAIGKSEGKLTIDFRID